MSKIFAHAKDIYSINPNFFDQFNIKYLVCDLDQTLVPSNAKELDPRAFKLKEDLSKHNIELLVVTNNHKKRVAPMCEKLGVRYLYHANKFFGHRVKRWLNKLNISVDECIFVGDLIYSDYLYVSKIKGRLILTMPLSNKDNIYTKLIRKRDNHLRNKWLQNDELGMLVPSMDMEE